jgi:Rieske Fe-S protein
MVPRMQQEGTPQRRTVVLAGVVVLAGGGALTACGSGDSTAMSSTTVPPTASDTAGSSPSPSRSGSGSRSTKTIVRLADVPIGGAVAAQAPSGAVIVAQPAEGRVVAFSAICTHQGCKVAPAGMTLNCPCHGSTFDAMTGRVLNGPAKADLAPVAVKISGQDVVAG